MALQQIYWEQIATEDITSGQTVNLGNPTASLENVYADNLYLNNQDIAEVINTNVNALNQFTASVSESLEFTGSNMTVKGDLNVLGTYTSIKSETVTLDDNIIELNGTDKAFGGLLIKDPTNPNLVSGSLLWDTTNDQWIAGQEGSELPIARQDDLVWGNSGSYWSSTSDLQVTGSVIIKGDLRVEGQTTLQSQDITQDSLIVSGAMSILKNQIESQVRSASLNIQNLGSIGDINNNSVMDLGGF
jgi:hypothetical protein